VIDRDECERYQDALDRLFEGAASEQDERQLRGHANTCPDCAVLLDLHRRLRGESLVELEAAVPAELVAGMWPLVQTEMSRDEWREAGRKGRSSVWRWVAAAQAAAIVVLAAGAVYLSGELETLKGRDADLADRVSNQQQYLSELDRRTSTDPHGAREYTAGTDWERRLGATGDVTVAEVTRYLRRLPADSPVLDARGTRRLLSSLPAGLPGGVRGAQPGDLNGIDAGDGLQAGEALALIDALNLDPSYQLPASRIMSLTKRYD
jgi:hypothetical protein